MADVARVAAVSPMTVSRALKADTSVSAATRERVREAADSLGYVLDSTAAGLSSRRSGFVAMTIPSINNANFADTARGLTEGLREAGLELLLGYTDYDVDEEERLIEAFLRRRPEALVVTGGAHTERCRTLLAASGVPVVETWDRPTDPIDRVVGFSNAEAGRKIAEHFHELGYRRIGYIGGDGSRDTRGADRRRGFVAALHGLGLSTDRMITDAAPPISMQEGGDAMNRLLDRWPDTEAVMCVSDLSAFGAMAAAQRRGLTIPDNIAIAGFGAYDLSEHAIPAITTIDSRALEIGLQTADLIREMLGETPSDAPRTVEVDIDLVVRPSTST
ncbi:MAG: LacI family DNA-binding transcriptional regulator [Pseudomonadota bacterium]